MSATNTTLLNLTKLEDTPQNLRPDTQYTAILVAIDGDTKYTLTSKDFTTVKLEPPRIFVNSTSFTQQPGRVDVSFPVWAIAKRKNGAIGE